MVPLWPVVLLALALWGVTCCSAADADWLGRSREEVVAELGKPLSALQRGDTEVLMYAGSVRVEVRQDEVVAFRSGNDAVIVASDGTRYTPTDRGKLQRVVPPVEDIEEDVIVAVVRATPAPVASVATAPVPEENSEVEETEDAEEVTTELIDPAPDESEDWMSDPTDSVENPGNPAADLEKYAEHGLMAGREDAPPPPPPWMRAVEATVGVLLRLGFVVLMLRIAISWVELPCYLPDVMKVAALYAVIREGLHGLAGLGGHWEWITLFRLDDVVSYFALMILIFKFKIALSGLTALKIATATKGVTYFLMLIVGVVWAFTIG